MPRYDYRCAECGRTFEIKMSMSDYSAGADVTCTECGSREAERSFTSFSVLTGGKVGMGGRNIPQGCGSTGFT